MGKNQQIKKGATPVKKVSAKKESRDISFLRFLLFDKTNRWFLIAGVIIGIIYAVVLNWIFPVPSFYVDSSTYIESAKSGVGVSFRPIGYSDFIKFFHDIDISASFLVMVQYASNVLANLFLFFSFLYFFPLPKWHRIVLFALLICNPLYLLSSNYILSEAFFCSLVTIWFTVLLWIFKRPNWLNFIAQPILLALVFKLRYNALYYPVFAAAAIFLSPQGILKKLASAALGFLVIAALIKNITDRTEFVTRTRVFSAFSGWQMASNALNVIKHTDIDSNCFTSVESRQIYSLSRSYFDSLEKAPPDTVMDENRIKGYIWDPNAPLKRYLPYFAMKKRIPRYFNVWTALGPVFFNFGKEVIINKPVQYVKYFLWPNTKQYWYPPLEAYGAYNNNKDSLGNIIKDYYKYKDSKIDLSHANINDAMMRPWRYLFSLINITFLLLAAVYYLKRVYKKTGRTFNFTLLFVIAFYIANFFFSVLVSPTVFRYQINIVTLCVLFGVYLIYYIYFSTNNGTLIKEPSINKGKKTLVGSTV